MLVGLCNESNNEHNTYKFILDRQYIQQCQIALCCKCDAWTQITQFFITLIGYNVAKSWVINSIIRHDKDLQNPSHELNYWRRKNRMDKMSFYFEQTVRFICIQNNFPFQLFFLEIFRFVHEQNLSIHTNGECKMTIFQRLSNSVNLSWLQ